MKYPHTSFMPLFLGVIATTGFAQIASRPAQKPIVITPPAVHDGSNWSRAPLPAQRQFDDVKPADGLAIDNLPPNTPATNTEPEIPAPRVAIFQRTTVPAFAGEPALMPTGRTTYVTGYPYQTASVATRPAEKPIVITPPAIRDGSNWSRAPMPAQRQFDDVKGPDGQAIDALPPNTPATNSEPVIPPPRVAIFQRAPATGFAAEPGLMPTGRTTVAVATTMDATNVAQSIRSGTAANRDQILNDIESRLNASEKMMKSMSGVASDVSAEVKAKAKNLKKSLSNARKDWDANYNQLAADYEAYAAALARVDAANGTAR